MDTSHEEAGNTSCLFNHRRVPRWPPTFCKAKQALTFGEGQFSTQDIKSSKRQEKWHLTCHSAEATQLQKRRANSPIATLFAVLKHMAKRSLLVAIPMPKRNSSSSGALCNRINYPKNSSDLLVVLVQISQEAPVEQTRKRHTWQVGTHDMTDAVFDEIAPIIVLFT
eukprot:945714-Amphidinium_carterae.2